MSVFGTIMSKIFGQAASAAPTSTAVPSEAGAGSQGAPSSSSNSSVAAGKPASGGVKQNVDVGAVLNGLAAKNSQKLNWSQSIVDLMKLLDMDSSLSARKELASELQYAGDTNDSAAMNAWLHKQVMLKLAENGGKVPDDLRR
jgi:hypothetical protein